MSGKNMATKKEDPPAFTLHNTNDEFAKKSDSLFSCLQTLEDKHKAFEKARTGNSSSSEEDDFGLLKKDPSEEETETITSAFKKPGDFSHRNGNRSNSGQDKGQGSKRKEDQGHRSNYNRPWQRGTNRFRGKRSHVPDFNDRPEKWTKYSLEDVDVMNESSNKGAAFAFLEERRKLREAAEMSDDNSDVKVDENAACSKGLFTFKRPDKSSDQGRQSTSSSGANDDVKSTLSDKVKFDSESDELKDSSVDVPESEDKSANVAIFKSSKNKGRRNIRKKESSDEED